MLNRKRICSFNIIRIQCGFSPLKINLSDIRLMPMNHFVHSENMSITLQIFFQNASTWLNVAEFYFYSVKLKIKLIYNERELAMIIADWNDLPHLAFKNIKHKYRQLERVMLQKRNEEIKYYQLFDSSAIHLLISK